MKNHPFTFRMLAAAALLAAAGNLAGCTTEELALENQYVPNSGSQQFPIIVEKGPTTLSIAGKSGTLAPGQINAVSGFARNAATSGASVTVSRPSAASPRLSHEVANLVAQQGVSSSRIHFTTYNGSAGGPVKVTYKAVQARTSPCGEWPADMTETTMNELNYNHGCAVQSNIAAMVANPNDFVTPRATDPASAASRVTAVQAANGTAGATTGSTSAASGGSSTASSSGITN